MQYSVCIDAVYRGKDFIKAMEEVNALGYSTIEFWGWEDKDIPAIKAQCNRLKMTVSTFCSKSTSLVDPKAHEAYLVGLKESLEVAKDLGVTKLITLVGNDTGAPRIEQHQHLIKGLKACVPLLEAAGVTLMIEALNTKVDHPGYYLTASSEACEVVEAVNSPFVKIIFDIYHQYAMGDEVEANIKKQVNYIHHFHSAGYPGRHELSHGEMVYPKIFNLIKASGYEGYIGLEYFPELDPKVGLAEVTLLV